MTERTTPITVDLEAEVERLRNGIVACIVGWSDDHPPHGPAIVAALTRLLNTESTTT